MIYLDKNYIRMLGSIPQALAACASFHEYTKVVQLRGESATVAWETQAAVRGGADILMVDTEHGRIWNAACPNWRLWAVGNT